MSTRPLPADLTLIDALRPARLTGWRAEALLILAGSLFIAVCAQITIPLAPVPITGQTFAVLLVGALFGARRGAAAVLAYLLEGACGLPAFAGFMAGPAHLAGPTGGYLVGFMFSAFIVGALSQRGWDRRVWTTLLAMALGTAVIFATGALWLAPFVGIDRVLAIGVLPHLPGAAIKISLAALVLPGAWRLIRS